MEKVISASEANRQFSRLMREVRESQRFVITSHGRAVARIFPASKSSSGTEAARDALFARLERQPALNLGPWNRDELYEDSFWSKGSIQVF